MGPWDTAPVQQEEEMDIFAILGAVPPAQTVVATTNQAMASTIAHDPLAAFMDDDEEETLVADSMFDLHEEPAGMFELMSEDAPVHEPVLNEPVTQHSLSNEVITELLEVLVKKELHARAER